MPRDVKSHMLQPVERRQKHLGQYMQVDRRSSKEVAQGVGTLRVDTSIHLQQMYRSSRPTSDHAGKANVGENNGDQPASQAQTGDAAQAAL